MDFWIWLTNTIRGLFQKPELTHPEEARNTKPCTDIIAVRDRWFADWQVPEAWRTFWRHVDISLNDNTPCAATCSELFTVSFNPYWATPGVMAHEMAHISYYLLKPEAKLEWIATLKNCDSPLVNYLFSRHPYGKTNPIEGHADIYRFLADRMPDVMKMYYPRLF